MKNFVKSFMINVLIGSTFRSLWMVLFLTYYGDLLIGLTTLFVIVCIFWRLEFTAEHQTWDPYRGMDLRTVLHNCILYHKLVLLLYRSCVTLILAKSSLWTLYSICQRQVRLLSRITFMYFASGPITTGKTLSGGGSASWRRQLGICIDWL